MPPAPLIPLFLRACIPSNPVGHNSLSTIPHGGRGSYSFNPALALPHRASVSRFVQRQNWSGKAGLGQLKELFPLGCSGILSCPGKEEEPKYPGQQLRPEEEEFQGAELSSRVGQGNRVKQKSKVVFLPGSGIRQAWVQIPVLPRPGCVTLSKSLVKCTAVSTLQNGCGN